MKAQRPRGSRAQELKKYVDQALAGGATEAKVIPADRVVTAEWVRFKCRYGCGGYGKRLCCPPHTPAPMQTRAMLADYRRALIYCYDIERGERRDVHRRMQKLVPAIERAMFLDGHYQAFGMADGPCRLCAACDPGKRCRFPELARPAMEACGIDVYATCRNAGIELQVVTCYPSRTRHVNLVLID